MAEHGIAGQLECLIVTPERKVVDVPADFVVLTAHDGQIGILPEHAALLCKLGYGVLRIDNDQTKQYFYVGGGFAEVRDNRVTVLTPRAVAADKLDPRTIDQAIETASQISTRTEADRNQRTLALTIARAERAVYLESRKSENQR